MKNSLFILFFLLIPLTIVAQTDKQIMAVYRYQKIFTEKEKAKRDSLIKYDAFYRSMLDFQKLNYDTKKYLMYFNDSVSHFNQEYILKDPEEVELFYNLYKNQYLYKNIRKATYCKNYKLFDIFFTVHDSLPDYHWKITGDTKKIGQYQVIKAIGREQKMVKENNKISKVDRKVTAWFTPEIPISNGPELFGGLPGLILEVNNEREMYVLTELVFNPKKKMKINKPELHEHNGDYEEFLKYREAFFKKRFKYFKNRRAKRDH